LLLLSAGAAPFLDGTKFEKKISFHAIKGGADLILFSQARIQDILEKNKSTIDSFTLIVGTSILIR
jgi:hypothetical protein